MDTKPRMISAVLVITSGIFLAQFALATPLIALKEANNCGGCHTPGRSQRPVLWRRCTLDCQGCHVDPSGAGPRNQWGYYYSQDQLSGMNFIKPIDPLRDESRFDIHYDGRIIQRDSESDKRMFPMSSELSLRARPFVQWLHLTYQKLFLGRIDDPVLRDSDPRRARDRYALMVDGLPFNLYAKIGRSIPLYGLRRPNHSVWIRERLGLDQFSTTDAVTFGGTPNVPFFHVSQMTGDPYAAEEDRQKGLSAHGGMRGVTLGWHVNGSYWSTKSTKAAIDMQALGVGANAFGLIAYGERNWRKVEKSKLTGSQLATLKSPETRVHPGSTISDYSLTYAGIPGLMVGVNWEDLSNDEQDSHRMSYVLDLHPVPNLQFELWRRRETGSRNLSDTLAVLHAYFDY